MVEEDGLALTARGGDVAATGALLTTYRERAKRIARRFGVQPQDVEDATSEVTIALLGAIRAFDIARDKPFRHYADTTIRHAITRWQCREASGLDEVHIDAGAPSVRELPDYEACAADESIEETEQLVAMRRAVDALPERMRRVIRRRLDGDEQSDIAADLGVTQQRVAKIEADAHDRLRAVLLSAAPPVHAAA